MNLRIWVVFIVLFSLVGCKKRDGEYVEKEREIGYEGEAKINRFLAAERFLEKMGLKASSYGGAPSLPPPEGATVILPAASLQSQGQLAEITDWMMEGGNLIAYLTSEKERPFLWGPEGPQDEEEGFVTFLDYFGLEVDYRHAAKDEGHQFWGEKVESLGFDRADRYVTDFRSPYFVKDRENFGGDAQPFVSYDYGEGSLAVFGSAELFTNRSIGKAEHASLFWAIADQGQNDTVWLIHSTRLSFFTLLWQRAPYAVVMLLVGVVLLVWWASRTFGPKFARGTNPSAKLDEHLEASGSFFRKHKAEEEVISHLRNKLFRRLARAMNQPFNVSSGDLISLGREEGVLDKAEATALTDRPTDKTLLTTLQTLKNLEHKL